MHPRRRRTRGAVDLLPILMIGLVCLSRQYLRSDGEDRRKSYTRQRWRNHRWLRRWENDPQLISSSYLLSSGLSLHHSERSRILPTEYSFLTEAEFRSYRFTKATFVYLDVVLKPMLSLEVEEGNAWGGWRHGVPSSIVIGNSLRMLAGGSHHDISIASGIHPKTVFKHMWKFIDALLQTELGAIAFFYEDLRISARITAGM